MQPACSSSDASGLTHCPPHAQLEDFSQMVRSDRRLAAAGMRDVTAVVEEAAAEAQGERRPGGSVALHPVLTLMSQPWLCASQN